MKATIFRDPSAKTEEMWRVMIGSEILGTAWNSQGAAEAGAAVEMRRRTGSKVLQGYAVELSAAQAIAPRTYEQVMASIQDTAWLAQIGRAFAAALREALPHSEWQEMLSRNAAEGADDVCHSHDFIDANKVMYEVMDMCGIPALCGSEPLQNDYFQAIWNSAWHLAKPLLGRVPAPKAIPSNVLRRQLRAANAAGIFSPAQAEAIAVMVEFHEDVEEVPPEYQAALRELLAAVPHSLTVEAARFTLTMPGEPQ